MNDGPAEGKTSTLGSQNNRELPCILLLWKLIKMIEIMLHYRNLVIESFYKFSRLYKVVQIWSGLICV